MNNRIQTLDVGSAGATETGQERARFERRWNRWNALRTTLGILATALFLVLLVSR